MHMGYDREFRPVQFPGKDMVDGKAIPYPVFAVFHVLIPDLIESRAPLQVGMLKGCSPAFGDLANDDLGVVVFEDSQEADQSRIASCLPCQAQTTRRVRAGPALQNAHRLTLTVFGKAGHVFALLSAPEDGRVGVCWCQ